MSEKQASLFPRSIHIYPSSSILKKMARVKAVRQQETTKRATLKPSAGDLLRATVVGVPAGDGRWLTLAMAANGQWKVPGCGLVPVRRGCAAAPAARAWAERLPLAERRRLAARQAGDISEDDDDGAADGAADNGAHAWSEVYRTEKRLAELRLAVTEAQAELGTLVLAATECCAGPLPQSSVDLMARAYPPQTD